MAVTFPNETPEYRRARRALLESEVALRREMEAVAAQLRALPPGGEVPEDYRFDGIGADGAPSTVRLSELFRGGDTVMLYHYMFPRHAADRRPGPTRGTMAKVPLAEGPCPSCTALVDMWEGTMPHFEGLGGNLAVVAKAPIERVAAFLVDMAERQGALRQVELPMSRVDIGDYLGLTIETVSRIFTRLKEKGIIRLVSLRCVEIIKHDALQNMSE